MSQFFNYFSSKDIEQNLSVRVGETKLGERMQYVQDCTQDIDTLLKKSDARYVILGIPEDIGVRANAGIGGTVTAWPAFVKSFLNIQVQTALSGNEILFLGNFDFTDWMIASQQEPVDALRARVAAIDAEVFSIVKAIVNAGKFPIIIGGGHNNAYPIIKACATALQMPINCINCDAHSDFRVQEGRHSGNGFRYAKVEQYLNKYALLGLHENYNSSDVVATLHADPDIYITWFEDIFIRKKYSFEQAAKNCIDFCKERYCGIEIDLDAIAQSLASAASPSGIALNDIRTLIHLYAQQLPAVYLHLCESAYQLDNGILDPLCGKRLSYLVSDFIKAHKSS